MEQQDKIKQIDFTKIFKAAIKHKKKYYYSLPITFAVACFIILCVPRYYTCTVQLAPETSSMNSNSISDLASSFGFNLGASSSGSDAIFPELYPQLMESVDFRSSLFPIKIKTLDGEINTTYYEYLAKHQKSPWWSEITRALKSLLPKDDTGTGDNSVVNTFQLTREQKSINDAIGGNVMCAVDKKTFVISISVTDQDPLVCALVADSVRNKLQHFITKYRTNKASIDLKYTEGLYNDAKAEYEEARRKYAKFSDENSDLILQSVKSKQEDLENDMQLKFNNYSTMATQLQLARAKVQEKTPAFTTLQSATVPLKPAGPKRMIFVGFMTILAFLATTIYVSKKEGCF